MKKKDYQSCVNALQTYEQLLEKWGNSRHIKKYLILSHKPKQLVEDFEDLDGLHNFSVLLATHDQSDPLVKKTILQSIGKLKHIFPSLRNNYYMGVKKQQDKRSMTQPDQKGLEMGGEKKLFTQAHSIIKKKKTLKQILNDFLKKKKLLNQNKESSEFMLKAEEINKLPQIPEKKKSVGGTFERLYKRKRGGTGVRQLDMIEKSFQESRKLTAECEKLSNQMQERSYEIENDHLKSELYKMTQDTLRAQVLFRNRRMIGKLPLDIRMNRVFPVQELEFLKRKRN